MIEEKYELVSSSSMRTVGRDVMSVTIKMADKTNCKIERVLSCEAAVLKVDEKSMVDSVTYVATVNLSVIFVDANGEVKSLTNKAEVSGSIKGEISQNQKVACFSEIVSATVERFGGSEITLLIKLETVARVGVNLSQNVLADVENAFITSDCGKTSVFKGCFQNHFELTDQLDISDSITKVLTTSATAVVERINVGKDISVVEGKVVTTVCYLVGKDGQQIKSFTVCLPYRQEVETTGSSIEDLANASINVENLIAKATVDEVKDKTILDCAYTIKVEGCFFASKKFDFVTEVFSTENELNLVVESLESFKYLGSYCDAVSKSTNINIPEETGELECVNDMTASIIKIEPKNGEVEIDCVFKANAIFKQGTEFVSSEYLLPQVITIKASLVTECSDVIAEVVPFEFFGVRRLSDQLEIKCKALVLITVSETEQYSVITQIEVGELKAKCQPAVTVYYAKAGETLIDIAKKLNVLPCDIMSQNKNTTFPLLKCQKLLVYRQLKR